jgi:hypothetical protein
VLRTPEGPALIWYVVWDDPRSAERFTTGFGEKLRRTERTGYRASFERLEMEGKPATRYLLAPEAWQGWENPPRPRVEP